MNWSKKNAALLMIVPFSLAMQDGIYAGAAHSQKTAPQTMEAQNREAASCTLLSLDKKPKHKYSKKGSALRNHKKKIKSTNNCFRTTCKGHRVKAY
jgi:hypothetical protein